MAVIEEAGAVPVRRADQDWDVLLVTAKADPTVWIFPKGHIEPGEAPADAAVREAHEEAGIRGRLISPAGSIAFTKAGDTIRVAYFLVYTTDPGTPEPGRRLAWLPFDEALQRVSFDETRALLRDARRQLDQFDPLRFSTDPTSDRK